MVYPVEQVECTNTPLCWMAFLLRKASGIAIILTVRLWMASSLPSDFSAVVIQADETLVLYGRVDASCRSAVGFTNAHGGVWDTMAENIQEFADQNEINKFHEATETISGPRFVDGTGHEFPNGWRLF